MGLLLPVGLMLLTLGVLVLDSEEELVVLLPQAVNTLSTLTARSSLSDIFIK